MERISITPEALISLFEGLYEREGISEKREVQR